MWTRRLSLALLVVPLFASPATPAAAGVEVYRALHRPAEELLPLAQAALADGGSVAVDAGTNSLVLLGEPDALARALELLRARDIAPATLVLYYEARNTRELEAGGIRVAWSASSGPLRAGNARFPGAADGVAISSLRQERTTGSRVEGVLRVLAGERGRIASGTAFPISVGRGRTRSTTWVEAESGIEVRPRVLGNGRIRLEIAPFDAQPEGASVRYSDASTTLTVEPGATVVIGGLASARQTRRNGASSTAQSHLAEEQVLLIRVEVEGADGTR